MLQTRHIGKVVLSLEAAAPEVYRVRAGAGFRRLNPREFVVHPGRASDYVAAARSPRKRIGTDRSHRASLECDGRLGRRGLAREVPGTRLLQP